MMYQPEISGNVFLNPQINSLNYVQYQYPNHITLNKNKN